MFNLLKILGRLIYTKSIAISLFSLIVIVLAKIEPSEVISGIIPYIIYAAIIIPVLLIIHSIKGKIFDRFNLMISNETQKEQRGFKFKFSFNAMYVISFIIALLVTKDKLELVSAVNILLWIDLIITIIGISAMITGLNVMVKNKKAKKKS